jgi:Domain of unknown function (DUF4190)
MSEQPPQQPPPFPPPPEQEPQPWPQPPYAEQPPYSQQAPPYPQQPYPPAYQPYSASRPWNGFAIASMVLGIVWVWWIGSILALIFGFIALRQVKRSNGWQRGRGMAIAGVVLGAVGIAALIAFIVLLVVYDEDDSYGDSASLDRLWDRCADGSMVACDSLFQESPAGSRYQEFGATCGDRVRATDEWCVNINP